MKLSGELTFDGCMRTLQELYKMTKARRFTNRYAFYDAVTGDILKTKL